MNDKYGRKIQPADIVYVTGSTRAFDVSYVMDNTAYLVPHVDEERNGEVIPHGESKDITLSPDTVHYRLARVGLLTNEDAARLYLYYSRKAAEEAAEVCGVNFTRVKRTHSMSADATFIFTKGDKQLNVDLDSESWWLEAKKEAIADSYCEEVYAEKFKSILVRELITRFAF